MSCVQNIFALKTPVFLIKLQLAMKFQASPGSLMLLLFVFQFSLPAPAQALYGVTLCGAEFGEKKLPGTYGTDYIYPSMEDVNYFSNKGADVIQLPIKWERIQPQLGGALNKAEADRINLFLDCCEKKNIGVIIVLQNFGRYSINNIEYIVGGNIVTVGLFRDFWMKMALAFRNKYSLYGFDIMAEPHDMYPNSWAPIVQQVIYAIRMVDNYTTIFVEGENYSNASTWLYYNNNLKYLKDPADKLVFNAHCYFDYDYSGRYSKRYELDGANEWTGVQRVYPFVQWLRKTGKKGYIGEFGVPKNDARWLKVFDNFLYYLVANNVGGSYWAAGRWWNDYSLSIHPVNKTDQPQLRVLQKWCFVQTNTSQSFIVSK